MPAKRDMEELAGWRGRGVVAIIFLIVTVTNYHNLRGLTICVYSFTFLEVRVQSET